MQLAKGALQIKYHFCVAYLQIWSTLFSQGCKFMCLPISRVKGNGRTRIMHDYV